MGDGIKWAAEQDEEAARMFAETKLGFDVEALKVKFNNDPCAFLLRLRNIRRVVGNIYERNEPMTRENHQNIDDLAHDIEKLLE